MVEGRYDNLDNLDDLEEEFRKEQLVKGYQTGLELGKQAGIQDGLQKGAEEGAKIGAEVGYYRGQALTWLHILQTNAPLRVKHSKALVQLQETIRLTREYPQTNELQSEAMLSKIRAKYKQSMSLLNLKS